MEEGEKPEPKISAPEIILVTIYLGIIDSLELLIVFIGLDDFWIGDILAAPVVGYLWLKGVPPMRQAIAWLAELVPYLGTLPILTVGFLATVYLDRHPKLAKVAQLASGKGVNGAAKGLPQPRGGGSSYPEAGEEAQEAALARVSSYEPYSSYTGGEEAGVEPAVAETQSETSEEALGVEKGEIEKLIDITRRMPEAENLSDEEKAKQYRQAA